MEIVAGIIATIIVIALVVFTGFQIVGVVKAISKHKANKESKPCSSDKVVDYTKEDNKN